MAIEESSINGDSDVAGMMLRIIMDDSMGVCSSRVDGSV